MMLYSLSRKKTFLLYAVFVVAILFAGVIQANGATLTVAQDGSGGFTAIQSALDAAQPGDTVIVHAGTYNEDINIGHFGTHDHLQPVKKDDVTLKAAVGEIVEVILPNTSNRLVVWAENYHIDLENVDAAGLVINGDRAVVDGLRITKTSFQPNKIGLSFTVYIGSSNVIIKNCQITGPSGAVPDPDPTITESHPVYIGVLTFSSLIDQRATDTTIENCSVSNFLIGMSSVNFFRFPGHDPSVRWVGCNVHGNATGMYTLDGEFTIEDCDIHDNNLGIQLCDGITTITNCSINNNPGNGIIVSEFGFDEDEPMEHPLVTINKCMIAKNGSDGPKLTDLVKGVMIKNCGVFFSVGTLNISNSVFLNNTGGGFYIQPLLYGKTDPYLPPQLTLGPRQTIASINHCDFFQTGSDPAISTSESALNAIDFSVKNSIVSASIGASNNTIDPAVDVSLAFDYCDVFTTGSQFTGNVKQSNIVNADPDYVDAVNGNFYLTDTSPVLTAGEGGTYFGSYGPRPVSIPRWMLY